MYQIRANWRVFVFNFPSLYSLLTSSFSSESFSISIFFLSRYLFWIWSTPIHFFSQLRLWSTSLHLFIYFIHLKVWKWNTHFNSLFSIFTSLKCLLKTAWKKLLNFSTLPNSFLIIFSLFYDKIDWYLKRTGLRI